MLLIIAYPLKYTVICRLVWLEESRSLSVTFIVKVIKDVKNIYVLENNQPLKMGIWAECHFGIRDKSHNFGSNRFRVGNWNNRINFSIYDIWWKIEAVGLKQSLIKGTSWGNQHPPIGSRYIMVSTELRCPNFGVNLQLNIELIRESCSGLSFIMNRIRSIQSGCSIISWPQNCGELSKRHIEIERNFYK